MISCRALTKIYMFFVVVLMTRQAWTTLRGIHLCFLLCFLKLSRYLLRLDTMWGVIVQWVCKLICAQSVSKELSGIVWECSCMLVVCSLAPSIMLSVGRTIDQGKCSWLRWQVCLVYWALLVGWVASLWVSGGDSSEDLYSLELLPPSSIFSCKRFFGLIKGEKAIYA